MLETLGRSHKAASSSLPLSDGPASPMILASAADCCTQSGDHPRVLAHIDRGIERVASISVVI